MTLILLLFLHVDPRPRDDADAAAHHHRRHFHWSGDRPCVADPKTGLKCYVTRHGTMGHLCGYVLLDATSPEAEAFRKEADASGERYPSFDVHGGVTFCGERTFTAGGPLYFAIGFDCAHWGDRAPWGPLPTGTYRTLEYVQSELQQLAEQVKSWLKAHSASTGPSA